MSSDNLIKTNLQMDQGINDSKGIDNSNLLNNNIYSFSDRFQNYIQANYSQHEKMLVIMNELIFYGVFIYYYYLGPIGDSAQNFLLFKFIAVIFAVRYLFSYLTTISKHVEQKKNTYFQINSKVAIFATIILFLARKEINNITTFLLIATYAMISSAARYGYTVDNLTTTIMVYFLFTSNLIN